MERLKIDLKGQKYAFVVGAIIFFLSTISPLTHAQTFQCEFENHLGVMTPCSEEDVGIIWPYTITDNTTFYEISRMGQSLSLPILPGFIEYDFQKEKISFIVTVGEKNNFNSISVNHNQTHRYAVLSNDMSNPLTELIWDDEYTMYDNFSNYISREDAFFVNTGTQLLFYFSKDFINNANYPVTIDFNSFIVNATQDGGWNATFSNRVNLDENDSVILNWDHSLEPFASSVNYWTMDLLNASGDISNENASGIDCEIVGTVSDRIGYRNRSRYFGAAGENRLVCPPNPGIDARTALTVATWFRKDTPGASFDRIVSRWNVGNDYLLAVTAADKVSFYIDGGANLATTTASISDGSFHCVVGRWNGSQLAVFIDGEQNGNVDSFAGPMSPTTNENLYIGMWKPGGAQNCIDCYIDELIVDVDKSWSDAEIETYCSNPYYATGNITTPISNFSPDFSTNISYNGTLDGSSSVNIFWNGTNDGTTYTLQSVQTGANPFTNYSITSQTVLGSAIFELVNGSTPHISKIQIDEGLDATQPTVTEMTPVNGTDFGTSGLHADVNFTINCADNSGTCNEGILNIWWYNGTPLNFSYNHYPIEYTVINGSYNSGALSDLQNSNNNYMHFDETSGCLGVTYNFTNFNEESATDFELHVEGRYEGSPTHEIMMYWRNYSSNSWVNFDNITNGISDNDYLSGIIPVSDFADANGNATLLLDHTATGCNPNHDLYLDHVAIHAIEGTTLNVSINADAVFGEVVDLTNGTYLYNWQVWDGSGNNAYNTTNGTITVTYTSPDFMSIIAPSNTTYNFITDIPLRVTTNETDISVWWYAINSGSNVTFIPNITLYNQANGNFNISICYNHSNGLENCLTRWYAVDYTGESSAADDLETDMGAIALALVAFMFAFVGSKFDQDSQRPIQVGLLGVALYFGALTVAYVAQSQSGVAVSQTSLIGYNLVVEMCIWGLAAFLLWKVIESLFDAGEGSETNPFHERNPFKK